jgi:hypothetical protein
MSTMVGKYTASHVRSPWKVFLGVLCIALVVVGGVLYVSHSHTDGKAHHPDCGLCVSSRMAVTVSAPPPQLILVHDSTYVEVPRPVARLHLSPEFALFSRPPPADSNCS